jgi:hypothetical protein
VCEAGKDVDGHYKVSVSVVVFGKRFHHGGMYKAVRQEGKYVLGKAKIKKWLETQETFGLHRQIIRKFRRRKVIALFCSFCV